MRISAWRRPSERSQGFLEEDMQKPRFDRPRNRAFRVLLGLTSILTLSGCPGRLDDPELFLDASSASTGTNAVAAPACLTTIFTQNCGVSGCHSAGATAAGGLDLISPGVTARLINQPATFAGVLMGPGVSCPPAKLVDTATPSASWLELKILGTQGSCGAQMPELGSFTSTDQQCITDFVNHSAPDAGP
jgi:hypothetical protein